VAFLHKIKRKPKMYFSLVLSLLFIQGFIEMAQCEFNFVWWIRGQHSISQDTTSISIHPSEPNQLSSDLNLTELINLLYENDLTSGAQPREITLNIMGISGIDLIPWPMLSTPMFKNGKLAILIQQSNINFYRNGTELSDEECSADIISKYGHKTTTFFNYRYNIRTAERLSRKSPTCPYLFFKAEMAFLSIYSLTNSILVRNLWRFKSVELQFTFSV
jgi:hypothetical protein